MNGTEQKLSGDLEQALQDVTSLGGRPIAIQDLTTATLRCCAGVPECLTGITAVFPPGQLTTVLGGDHSGSGALLGVLAGMYQAQSGTVSIGEQDPTTAKRAGVTAFVDSFDTPIANLTVERQLRYAADLACPRSVSPAERAVRVEATLVDCHLIDRRRMGIGDPYAPGITAEELRLLSIAQALLSEPAVLLVDQPTVGLGGPSAARVLAILRAVAQQRGITVVAAVGALPAAAHAAIHTVLVLHHGLVAYLGSPGAPLVSHFESALPTAPRFPSSGASENDWLLETLQDVAPSDINGAWVKSSAATAVAAQARRCTPHKTAALTQHTSTLQRLSRCCGWQRQPIANAPCATPTWAQLLTLLKHRSTTNFTDPFWLAIRIADKLFFSLFVMSFYWHRGSYTTPASFGNIFGLVWMLTVLPCFSAAMFFAPLVLGMPAVIRDKKAGWVRGEVWLTHALLEEWVLTAAMTPVYAAILWFPLRLYGSFVAFWITLMVHTCFGIMLAYTVAVASPSLEVAGAVFPLSITFLLWFGGAILFVHDMPPWWRWMHFLDPLHYSFGAHMINAWDRPALEGSVLKQFDVYGVNKWAYIGYEALFVIGGFLLTAVVLTVKTTTPRYRLNVSLHRG
mmetsp:Transcript_11292/g.33953  ORF Transcript_11292/g.33953 Transcript_11292/m.33953 type:complete len:625 (-) Transcript_11292:289-2163(-)